MIASRAGGKWGINFPAMKPKRDRFSSQVLGKAEVHHLSQKVRKMVEVLPV